MQRVSRNFQGIILSVFSGPFEKKLNLIHYGAEIIL